MYDIHDFEGEYRYFHGFTGHLIILYCLAKKFEKENSNVT
jgi:hypothetical protein